MYAREKILAKLGIEALNVMQQDMAQAYRKSQEIVLLSPTGTGKTLAYLLPMLESMKPDDAGQPQTMVIVPSRELALQTVEVVRQSGTSVRAVAVYGGRPAMEEHRTLRGVCPHIVVGTPGRILDHLTKGNVDASTIRTLVIDEFDKCLELGFREDMERIFACLGNVVKRILLSATDNPEITRFLPTYTRLDYLAADDKERIRQYLVRSRQKDKLTTLEALLRTLGEQSTLVFVGYRESVERVAAFLRAQGFYVSAFHGGMEQRDRERALFRFISGSVNILVSTDLASRGLDIPALDNVVHYHLPASAEALTHRNGRTARWDGKGNSYLILGPEEKWDGEAEELALPMEEYGRSIVPKWETLYIGKGKKEKLSRGDVAGFLMKVGGLECDEVGRIDIREHCCYAAVARERVGDVLKRVKGQKIKGIKTIVEKTW